MEKNSITNENGITLVRATTADRAAYIALAQEFYASPAVLHAVPDGNFSATFDEAASGSPYVGCFLIKSGADTVGYVLTAKTYSQEAGGKVIWIEEIYIKPEFRGRGIGASVLDGIRRDAEKEGAARLRLEYEPSNRRAVSLYARCGYSDLGYGQMLIELKK